MASVRLDETRRLGVSILSAFAAIAISSCVQPPTARHVPPSARAKPPITPERAAQPFAARPEALALRPGNYFGLPDDGDNFIKMDRAVAKTRPFIGAPNEMTLQALLSSRQEPNLNDDYMRNSHNPPMQKGPEFDRVVEEKENVTITGWVIFIGKEGDNDFHLIVATSPGIIDDPQHVDRGMLMNMEVSGLPPVGTDGRNELVDARDQLKRLFPDFPTTTGGGYTPITPPRHVTVTGSLFYDYDHPPGKVGNGNFKPATAWEVHPITDIEAIP